MSKHQKLVSDLRKIVTEDSCNDFSKFVADELRKNPNVTLAELAARLSFEHSQAFEDLIKNELYCN